MEFGRRSFLRCASAGAGLLACTHFLGLDLMAADSRVPPAREEDGFRSLFDGKTLNGWNREPRSLHQKGRGLWAVEDGMIIGEQQYPKVGSYLTTEDTFGDFELEIEARPDWPADTGVLVRTNAQGNRGFQVCIDYRPHGAIVGYYGNDLGGFHACDYCFTGKEDADGRLVRLIPEKPSEPLDATHHVELDYALPASRFLSIWNLHGWNRFRIRSVGAVPRLTTWINGLKVAELDTAKVKSPGWDPGNLLNLIGRAGHISLEVHSNGPHDWLGKDRWAPGAACRWRNIYIRRYSA